eukprot:2347619-Amphidinium_carterae.1
MSTTQPILNTDRFNQFGSQGSTNYRHLSLLRDIVLEYTCTVAQCRQLPQQRNAQPWPFARNILKSGKMGRAGDTPACKATS